MVDLFTLTDGSYFSFDPLINVRTHQSSGSVIRLVSIFIIKVGISHSFITPPPSSPGGRFCSTAGLRLRQEEDDVMKRASFRHISALSIKSAAR